MTTAFVRCAKCNLPIGSYREFMDASVESVFHDDCFTMAEALRAETIIKRVAKTALTNYQRINGRTVRGLQAAFEGAILKEHKKLVAGAKMKPQLFKLPEVLKKKRADARKELCGELRNGKKRLKSLNWKIEHAEDVAFQEIQEHKKEARRVLADKLTTAKDRLKQLRAEYERVSEQIHIEFSDHIKAVTLDEVYSEVPLPWIAPSDTGDRLPSTAGVYFFWKDGVVEYVGRSKNLCNRVRLGTHHVLRKDHEISFLPFDVRVTTWAECYYIGVVRPMLNFGRNGSHNAD